MLVIDRNCFLLIVDVDIGIDVIEACLSRGRCLEARGNQGQAGATRGNQAQGQAGATGGKDKRGGMMVVDGKGLADLLMCAFDIH